MQVIPPAPNRPDPGGVSPSTSVLAEQIDWYLDVLAARPASARTITNYRWHLNLLERFAVQRGCDRAELLTAELVRATVVDLMATGRRAMHASPAARSKGNEAAARILVIATRGLLGTLRKQLGLPVPDLTGIGTPRVPQRLQPRVDMDAFARLEAALEHRAAYPRFPRLELARDRALVQLLFETGLRAEEASRLDVADVDLERGRVLVREGKGRKPRVLGIADPLSPDDGGETVRRLRAYLAKRPAGAQTRALWLGRHRQRLSPESLREILRRLCEEAELDRLPVHAFRRGHFSLAYQREPRDLPVLCARMGWSPNSQLMIQTYTRGAVLDFSALPRPLLSRALVGD